MAGLEEKITGGDRDNMGQEKNGLVRLDTEEITQVYKNHMMGDFPKSELKPLASIFHMLDKGIYECLGFFAEGELKAYIFLLADRERGFLLLDYLAVCENSRQEGWGSRSMERLREYYRDKKGIFLECESLKTAKNEEELRLRRRRISFYERNGCVLTGVEARVFGVEFEILYLPLTEQEADGAGEFERLYRKMLPDEIYRKQVRIWQGRNR